MSNNGEPERLEGWQSVRVQNFRRLKDSGSVDYAPITLLFGKNSSGKTSLLRAPLLLKQALEAGSNNEASLSGPLVDFGSYKELVFNGELSRDVVLSAIIGGGGYLSDRALSRIDRRLRPLFDRLRIDVRIHWNRRSGVAQYESIQLADPETEEAVVRFERRGPSVFDVTLGGGRAVRVNEPLSLQSIRYMQVAFHDETDNATSSTSSIVDVSYAFFQLTLSLQVNADRLIHIGPLRELPQRSYRTEQLGAADSSDSAVAVLRSGEGLPDIERALQSMGMASSINVHKLAPGFVAVTLNDPETGRIDNLADVGFGVSQVLPIIATLATAPAHSTVLIEQPELHLHPEAQGALADVLFELASRRKLRLVIETHSEHILLRLQRRTAERTVDPSDIAVYFIDSGQVSRAAMDSFGQIDSSAMPPGFFEEDWSDLMKLTEAAAARSA